MSQSYSRNTSNQGPSLQCFVESDHVHAWNHNQGEAVFIRGRLILNATPYFPEDGRCLLSSTVKLRVEEIMPKRCPFRAQGVEVGFGPSHPSIRIKPRREIATGRSVFAIPFEFLVPDDGDQSQPMRRFRFIASAQFGDGTLFGDARGTEEVLVCEPVDASVSYLRAGIDRPTAVGGVGGGRPATFREYQSFVPFEYPY